MEGTKPQLEETSKKQEVMSKHTTPKTVKEGIEEEGSKDKLGLRRVLV